MHMNPMEQLARTFSKRLTAPERGLAGSVVAVRAVVGAMLILMLAACSSGSDHAAPAPTLPTSVPTSTVPAGATGGTGGSGCTPADLLGPALSMPAPRRVVVPIVLGGGTNARLEPAPGANPQVSAEQAWQKLTALNPQRARSGELLLGTFRASFAFGPNGPQQEHLLAWVLRVHHLAYEHPPAEDPTRAGAAPAAATCEFVDGYLVIDATTGNRVVNSY